MSLLKGLYFPRDGKLDLLLFSIGQQSKKVKTTVKLYTSKD